MQVILVNTDEVQLIAIRAQGAGGQNVNKVSSAIHLRFDIAACSLPEEVKARLLALRDSRITQDGVLVLKAQQHRTQESNKFDALARLQALVDSVARAPTPRRPTRPTRASKLQRLTQKRHHAETKSQRKKDNYD